MRESVPDGLFQILGAVKQRAVRALSPAAGVESLPVHLHQLPGQG